MWPLSIPVLCLFIKTVHCLAEDNDNAVTVSRLSERASHVSYEDPDEFRTAILNTTNDYRSEHSAPPLTWNKTLASFSARHARDCEFEHSGGPYGENLAMGYPNASAAVAAWGDERGEYDYGDAEFSTDTGHFTQLVWNATEEVGCGREDCGDRGWMVVCEYSPPGNVEGQFEDEVGENEDAAARLIGGSWSLSMAISGFWGVVFVLS